MAKHKAATEITIAQEERSAFAEFVDQYKWIGAGLLVVIGAVIVWMSRSSNVAVESNRADWGELYAAGQSDDPVAAFASAASDIDDPKVAALANVNRSLALLPDREYGTAEEALAMALQPAPDLFTKVTFPIGADGAEQALLPHLQASMASEKVWMEAHRSLYENPPLPADAPKIEFETTAGKIVVGLYVGKAPEHAKNLMRLAGEGYFDGIRFHRVMAGQFIQAGDPNSRTDDVTTWGTGGTEATIPSEDSGLVHAEGVLAAAKKPGASDSSGSQFYLTCTPIHGFDGQYVVYGSVVEGLEIIREASEAETREDKTDAPVEPITINSTTVIGS